MSQSHRSSLKSTSSASIRESFTSSNKSVTFNDTVVQSHGFSKTSRNDSGSGDIGSGGNESETNLVGNSQDFWDWRSSFSDIGRGRKVLLASNLSSPGMIHIPRSSILQQESLQLTDNCNSDRAHSSKTMLKWSGTGSLPLIAGNEELLVPRRNSERIHVIFPVGRNSPLTVATPTGSPINHPPTTANATAQTRSVRFDRRRPQTLELRRGSSPSYVGGGCSEVDSYLMAEQKSLRRANLVIGIIATLIFLLCVAMVAVTLYFTPVMNQFANGFIEERNEFELPTKTVSPIASTTINVTATS